MHLFYAMSCPYLIPLISHLDSLTHQKLPPPDPPSLHSRSLAHHLRHALEVILHTPLLICCKVLRGDILVKHLALLNNNVE